MKSFLGKKAHWFNEGEYMLSFKNKENLLKFWQKCLDRTNYHNFANEPEHWASFCRNEKMSFRPHVKSLTITITVRKEQME